MFEFLDYLNVYKIRLVKLLFYDIESVQDPRTSYSESSRGNYNPSVMNKVNIKMLSNQIQACLDKQVLI